MYVPRVNRGLSFTKPGMYSFCLVLLLGMIAVSSGINGLYVFLSAGLGGFIVSGMLSELAIRSCSVLAINGALVDAATPFVLNFAVGNSSSWFSVFAMRSLFLLERPKFRLISHDPKAIAATRLHLVAPGSTDLHEVTVQGLPRGLYHKLYTLQTTTFPFGILEKYKLQELPAEIIVAPRLDPDMLAQVRLLLQADLRRLSLDQEFYTHRPYSGREARRAIDWKKSANRPVREWLLRDYRAPAGSTVVWLELPSDVLRACSSEERYEALLLRARAAIRVLDDARQSYALDFGAGRVVQGNGPSLMALARVPAFGKRWGEWPGAWQAVRMPKEALRLRLDS